MDYENIDFFPQNVEYYQRLLLRIIANFVVISCLKGSGSINLMQIKRSKNRETEHRRGSI